MGLLTLSDIARATGAGKATIKRAIDSGRLSVAARNDKGHALVDPAEVLRVWPDADLDRRFPPSVVPPVPPETNGTAALEERIAALEATLERERRQAHEERMELVAALRELPKALTDQRVERTERRWWWRGLFGR